MFLIGCCWVFNDVMGCIVCCCFLIVKMVVFGSCVLWSYCGYGWLWVMWCCRFFGFCSFWFGGLLGVWYLFEEKWVMEMYFGFEIVLEEEKGGKGERGERVDGGI